MPFLVVGALVGAVLGWIFRRQLLALGSGGVEAAGRAAEAARGAADVLVGGERLEEMTKEELYERARQAEIPGRSEMSKEELIAALENAA